MLGKNRDFDQAKEKIRRALVYEYLKKHPGVREQDVILACRNGELVFTEISTILADAELRQQSTSIFKQANTMFAELAIHQDERWNDCVESIRHCMQMIDCLHSTLFECFDDTERNVQERFCRIQERLCSRITVRLHETVKQMKSEKGFNNHSFSSRNRGLMMQYLNHVIDQLNVLHTVLNREVDLGDIFAEETQKFIDVKLSKIPKMSTAFRIEDISNLYKTLNGKKSIPLENAFAGNENLLVSTKNTLGQAVDVLKKNLTLRRKKIQEIWMTISTLQTTVKDMETIQNQDEEGTLPSLNSLGKDNSSVSRMVRFLSRFHLVER